MSQLRVITGPPKEPFPIPGGVSTIGRDYYADFVLEDGDISRRHARLERNGARVVITDLNSSNGTSINGLPLQGSYVLRDNDEIRLGQIVLKYDANWPAVHVDPGLDDPTRNLSTGSRAPTRRRVRLGQVVLVELVGQVLALLATSAFTFIAGRALGIPAWLLAQSVPIAVGVLLAIFKAVAGPAETTNGAQPGQVRGRGVPAVAAVLTVLLIGALGYGATLGIRYGVGYFTGTEDQIGRERLVSTPAPSGASGRVSVTVTSIVDTAHYTRVKVTVTNQEDPSLSTWVEAPAP